VLVKLQKKWTTHRVIEEEQKANILQQICEEYQEETGQKPGQKEVLKRYKPTMMAIMMGWMTMSWSKPGQRPMSGPIKCLMPQSRPRQLRRRAKNDQALRK
jgi:hypothetical protein